MIVAKAVQKNHILQDVSLDLRAGELLCAIGPNGAGKSTLLKLLSGEWTPTAGSVELNGRLLSSWSARDRAAVVAVLPQHSALSADFTALEVVLMGRIPHRETRRDHDIARQALAAAEALHLETKLYPKLSGGEQQSIQLARVLAQVWDSPEPNLLLDEPTANLDPAQQHRVLTLARNFARQGGAVLAILHDLNLAAEYADRIAILKAGRLTALGNPAHVLTPRIVLQNFNFNAIVVPHPNRQVPLILKQ